MKGRNVEFIYGKIDDQLQRLERLSQRRVCFKSVPLHLREYSAILQKICEQQPQPTATAHK